MAAESFLLLAKVSYAEDPPSARTFRWTHLTQNLTLAVGRWAGLSPSISGQSLGIFQGQSTLITINVEEMIRDAQRYGAASDKAWSGFNRSQPSLSAIYLYPALALSYCTQQNMIRRVQVKFHTVSDFGIVYDFLQRVKCPLSRWSGQLSSNNVTSHSTEEPAAYDRRQSATQQTYLTMNSLEALGETNDIPNNYSQIKSSQAQGPGEASYNAQLSYNPNTGRISDVPIRPEIYSVYSTQGAMTRAPIYTHSSQNGVADLATYPSTLRCNANVGAYDGLPSTAPPALSYSHQRGNGGHKFLTIESSMPRSEQLQYAADGREFSSAQLCEHQDDQITNGNKGCQENGSPNINSNKEFPPRRELPWLRPRAHASVADLPPLLSPQLASKVTKGKQNATVKSSSSPIEKRATKGNKNSSVATRRTQSKSQTPVRKGSAKRTSQKTCEKNDSASKSSKGNKDDASGAEGQATQKPRLPQASYKDASTSTDKQSVVDHMYNLLSCGTTQRAVTDKATPTLATYAHQVVGERAAIVNHMIAEVLYDPYFATLCNDIQTYLKGSFTNVE